VVITDVNGDIVTKTGVDSITGNLVIHREQDTAPYVDEIARLKQVSDGRGKHFYHAGKIPSIVVEKYCREKGITFREFLQFGFKDMLNDPDYSKLRIWEGRI
jgi:hypothetical protein